ncbi:MAG TPA: hypothetical protein VI876_00275 [Dehalococcoidia bacterium]|nr:hypothetical protein [Dehalococcoidia bacterium]
MSIRALIGRVLIAVVVVNAAAGVLALILSSSKQVGSFEGHVLVTTGAVSLAILGALPCALAWEKRGLTATFGWPATGLFAIVTAAALVVVLIWTDRPDDNLSNVSWSALAIAFAAVLFNLLSLAELQPSQRWVRWAAYVLAALLAAQWIDLIWTDDAGDGSIRRFGATAILLAGASSVVPILQRLHDSDRKEAALFCPRCGSQLPGSTGREASCGACGAAFRVEFS